MKKGLLSSFAHLVIGSLIPFVYNLCNCLPILDISPLYAAQLIKICPALWAVCSVQFPLLRTESFDLLFWFVPFWFAFFLICPICWDRVGSGPVGALCESSWLSRYLGGQTLFSSKSFPALGFTWRSLIRFFYLIILYKVKDKNIITSSVGWNPVFPPRLVDYSLSFATVRFYCLCKKLTEHSFAILSQGTLFYSFDLSVYILCHYQAVFIIIAL